jgi:hypothetical protein
MDGLMMLREEECAIDEEIGVLCGGKIFRHSRKRTLAEREGKYNEIEERDTGIILQIKAISCREEKEKDLHSSSVEEYLLHPTQARLCVKPTIPCVSCNIPIVIPI